MAGLKARLDYLNKITQNGLTNRQPVFIDFDQQIIIRLDRLFQVR